MISKIRFTKMHGAGNDYIFVNAADYNIKDPGSLAVDWSKRHTGIGSDGLVLIEPSKIADFAMRIFNADGSEADMCGNASRCVGKYVYEKKMTGKQVLTLETRSGIKTLQLHVVNEKVNSVTVDMGQPNDIRKIYLQADYALDGIAVNMGNQHLVIFVDDIASIDLNKIGPKLEHHPLFPQRTNVEFAQLIGKNRIRMRVWERGSGITMACGTGACATLVSAVTQGFTDRKAEVVMDGGTVRVEWEIKSGGIMKTGQAKTVFEGEI